MISWHNAPEYSYKGYIYKPDVDEYDDGVRKAWHNVVSRENPNVVVFTTNHSPYSWMKESEFKEFIDRMEKVTAT
tara:strand:+ start:517 stop:741 length:225 start_codon:yes stop_codon:yes gene_type:complete